MTREGDVRRATVMAATRDGTPIASDIAMFANDGKPAVVPCRALAHARRRLPMLLMATTAMLCGASLSVRASADGATALDAAGATQSLEVVLSTARRAVLAALPAGDVHVEAGPLDPRLRLRACATPPAAHVQSLGTGRATVLVQCAGPQRWTLYVASRIESRAPVLRLLRAAGPGYKPAATDVAVETVRVPGVSADYVTQLSQIERHHLRRSRPAGSLLRRDDFATDAVVRRGEQVMLVAALAGLEVRSRGRALADARPGERLRVQSEGSLKVVEGRADEQRRVWVTSPQEFDSTARP
jgi:flagellar basal body P-ring formation protein FlgA